MSERFGARHSGRGIKTNSNNQNQRCKAKLRQACLDRVRNRRSEIVSRSRRQKSSNRLATTSSFNAMEMITAFAEEEGLSECALISLMEEMEEEIKREG